MMTLEPPRGVADEADPWKAMGLSKSGMSRFLRSAQEAVGLRGEVDVLLADDRTLRRLNRSFRGKDKATDVLSFPAAEELKGVHAGDLAISLDTAGRQASEQGHSLRDEVRVLLLHGLLHLRGMDHEVDGGEMAKREGVLRAKLRLSNGLIARVEGETGATAKAGNTGVLRSAQDDGEKQATATALNAKGAKGRRKVRGGGGVAVEERRAGGGGMRSGVGR